MGLSLMVCFILFYGSLAHAQSYLDTLKDQDFATPPMDKALIDLASTVPIKENTKLIETDEIKLFYREALPPSGVVYQGDVLLLHGAAYSSDTWASRVGKPGPTTMQLLAAAGYRVVAIDQPGGRKTVGSLSRSRSAFMVELLELLNLHKPVIVTPSYSGSFSMAFAASYSHLVGALVTVAPCCTNQKWENVKIPLLVVQGSDDGSPSSHLLSTAHHNVFIVPKAGHAAYLHQPDLWHTTLINFLAFTHPEPSMEQTAQPLASQQTANKNGVESPISKSCYALHRNNQIFAFNVVFMAYLLR